MIPKTIHYCWFGGNPLPEDAIKCIKSWEKYCPDYEIIEWNESNFDVNACPYVSEAYEAKKWAFVSDYARFWILYNYGGLYFDIDVELIKSISDIVEAGEFMGKEPFGRKCRVAAGLGLGAEKGNQIYKEVLDIYGSLRFKISEGVYNDETVVTYITNVITQHGYVGTNIKENIEGILIYPTDYFCPINMDTGEISITENTRSIHWYNSSWKDSTEVAIHKKAMEIYHDNPNFCGKLLGQSYETTHKVLYYLKKEGLQNTMNRIFRKIKKKTSL